MNLNKLFALPLALLLAGMQAAPAPVAPAEFVVVFQRQKDPTKVREDADRFAASLAKELGIKVSAVVPTDYSASVQALVSKKADLAYVSAMPFLLARRDGGAQILLAEARKPASGEGDFRTVYDSVWVVPADSPLKTYDDLIARAKDTRVVFTSPTSTSGYVIPYARLVNEGHLKKGQDPRELFASVAFANGYTGALEQVAAGRADATAVSDYTMEGAKADVYLPADKRAKLRVLARTPNVPTHLLAVRGGLPDDFKLKLKAALLKLSTEHPEELSAVYGATRLVEVDEDAHIAPALNAIRQTGIPVEGLAK